MSSVEIFTAKFLKKSYNLCLFPAAGSNSPIDLTHLAPQDGDVHIPLEPRLHKVRNGE